MTQFDTCFAKIVSDTEGWDRILIEGTIVSLSVADRDLNNEIVDVIVRGLRSQSIAVGGATASIVPADGGTKV